MSTPPFRSSGLLSPRQTRTHLSSPESTVDAPRRAGKDAASVRERGNETESLGERLRRLRRERGLSQRDIASPGVSYAYVSRIEAGARQPSVKALRKLARKLEVSAEYLETGTDVRPAEERELRLSQAELRLRLEQDIADSERDFRSVLEEAAADGDGDAVLRARLGLGEVAFRRGDYVDAVRQLETPLAEDDVSPLSHGDVFATLARAYSGLGRPERAVELLEGCLAEVRERAPDDVAAEVRFATYLSYALADRRDLGSARKVIREALTRAEGAADAYSRVRLYWSLARLALMEGKPRTALRQIHRAIGLLEATEDTRQLARAHLFCGETLIDDGDAAAAGTHFEQAERLLGEGADAADLGWLWSEQARERTASGEHAEAAGLAERALDVLKGSDPLKLARAHAALAGAHAAGGDVDAAHVEYGRSVTLFADESRWQEAAATSRAWAQALRDAGRDQDAFDVLDRAAEYAARAPSGLKVS
jgi:transcriptional regulator with XRE-family HTH domain